MARRGLRILSLDGGGTRGLSSLYILREIFDRVLPGHGGDVRPSEYFHLMGGSGIGGLCVLLFARFCLTINEAIEFASDLMADLDAVEDLLSDIEAEAPDVESWRDCIDDYDDCEPSERLEALRQAIVQDKWQAAIRKWISDSIDRFPFLQDGEFEYKYPSAEIAAGRVRAFAVSSESPGYGRDGGTDSSHQYHVPILHRAYYCRHARPSYTFYAVGLATVAVPDVMKPGVIFPTLLATGAHTAHNPTQLLLEEGRKLWPGVRVGTFVSIGTGTFDVQDYEMTSASRACMEACFRITADGQRLHKDMGLYVLPYDVELKCAYSRFDLPGLMPFLEYVNRDYVLHEVKEWLQGAQDATTCAQVGQSLLHDNFPTTPEDCLAITSLAELLHLSLRSSYLTEAGILSDIISNYLLYESDSLDGGSFRKLQLATTVGTLSQHINQLYQAYDGDYSVSSDLGGDARVVVSSGILELNGEATDEFFTLNKAERPSEIVAACYHFLLDIRQERESDDGNRCPQSTLQNLGTLIGLPTDVNHLFIFRVEMLLKLATAAAICQAGTVETLRGVKGILYNGTVIRHTSKLLNDEALNPFDERILIPIANAIATSISMKNWSKFRDKDIISLLTAISPTTCDWAFVNLAIERLALSEDNVEEGGLDNITTICLSILQSRNSDFRDQRIKLLATSVVHGHRGLLMTCLTCENLYGPDSEGAQDAIPGPDDILRFSTDSAGNTLLHTCCKLGYAAIAQLILEQLPKQLASAFVNHPNRRGQTALHLAAKHRGSNAIFWLLFNHGANVHLQCRLGRTPLHYCFPEQSLLPEMHSIILDLVVEYTLSTTVPTRRLKLHPPPAPSAEVDSRVMRAHDIADRLLRRMEYPAIQDAQGLTALCLAVSNGWEHALSVFFDDNDDYAENMQALLLTIQDYNGRTCLDHARKTGTSGSIRGGEEFIAAEMTKRRIVVPPKIQERVIGHTIEVRRTTRLRSEERSPFPVSTPDDVLRQYGLVKGQEAAGQRQMRVAGNAYFPFLASSSQAQEASPASSTRSYSPQPPALMSTQPALQQYSGDRPVEYSSLSPEPDRLRNVGVINRLEVPRQSSPSRNKSSSPRRFLQRFRKGS